ncbi:DNA-binding transcriptional regulator, LacI/PurR family [Micromonospora pallida]|uniref:DNA-binding transcriptional regulator, LacI/PurR family n=1 Tax=Micromonospora pallida TaxID=145854 RepID=A0A1C6SZ71_9ACTN|nr:LacI family DNA-binding transcriptional regulator [Micromonospora pallida]SCL34884.1 DNA-binding transcriptional regulator, LacI/PurR family [Micromonospora pallida]
MTMPAGRGRLTQHEIARMAGVSQTTVSLVLNDRTEAAWRIAPETRDRVLRVIRETGYVADPLARRLLKQHNQILGVFTYESVFPSTSANFYHPFLSGIEACAENIGCDLLLFTSAPVRDGSRRIFHDNNRIRLADGCVLLGREIPPDELARMVAGNMPFVSIGRRDDAHLPSGEGGPVPYVGADYARATADLVHRAVDLGHRTTAYVGAGTGPESAVDRLAGYTTAVRETEIDGRHEPVDGRTSADLLDALRSARVTVVFCEELVEAAALAEAARARGLSVPGDLSLVTLGDPIRHAETDLDFTGFRLARREMGWQSIELLDDILHGRDTAHQRLLPCEPVEGETLAAPGPATGRH